MSNNIAFLQDTSFTKEGKPVFERRNRPALIMVKASWCGHCIKSAPAFQNIADNASDKVMCCVIREGDGQTPSEAKLMERLKKIMTKFEGFPYYTLVDIKGNLINDEPKGRSELHLIEYVNKYGKGKKIN